MSEIPTPNPERKEVVADNDRKFTLETIHPQFLTEHNARSYILITDWLETNEADETNVAYKKFDDGKVQILLIAKTTVDCDRTAEKKEIDEAEYEDYLLHAKVHVEKKRSEFDYAQEDGSIFAIKYDEFTDSSLRVLEAGAGASEDTDSFNPDEFPYELKEVSDDSSFTGFRVVSHI